MSGWERSDQSIPASNFSRILDESIMQCLNAKPLALRSARSSAPRAATRIFVAQRNSVADVVVPASRSSASSSPALALSGAAALLIPMLMDVPSALAKDGEFGLLEGTTAALVHPAMMFTLLASSVYAGYLGFQWRRTREVRAQFPTRSPKGYIHLQGKVFRVS